MKIIPEIRLYPFPYRYKQNLNMSYFAILNYTCALWEYNAFLHLVACLIFLEGCIPERRKSSSASSNTTLFVAERFCSKAQPIQMLYLYILGHCNASSFLSVVCCPVPNIFALCTNLTLVEGYTYASGCSGVSRTKTRSLWPWHQLSNKSYYLIFSTFLFEIKDGRTSDKILYHHTGDKRIT